MYSISHFRQFDTLTLDTLPLIVGASYFCFHAAKIIR